MKTESHKPMKFTMSKRKALNSSNYSDLLPYLNEVSFAMGLTVYREIHMVCSIALLF